jgi:epoxyqueuosine reductase QueG
MDMDKERMGLAPNQDTAVMVHETCNALGKVTNKIADCPPNAFYNQPVHHENGLVTVLDNGKCFPYFMNYHGCSICIKVCPFNQQGYDKIKEGFLQNKERELHHAH